MVRDWSFAAALFAAATQIPTWSKYLGALADAPVSIAGTSPVNLGGAVELASKYALWGLYFWYQGLVFTGIWILGHEVRPLCLSLTLSSHAEFNK